MGRPKKPNASKPGELKPGQMRFTFIGDEFQIMRLKKYSIQEDVSMKNLMHEVINHFFRTNKSYKRNLKSQEINENKLRSFLKLRNL